MKLFWFEIKKLLHIRYLWAFLALFLTVNGFLAYESAGQEDSRAYNRAYAAFCDNYYENAEELEAYRLELLAIKNAIGDENDHDDWEDWENWGETEAETETAATEKPTMPPNRYAIGDASDIQWIGSASSTTADHKAAYYERLLAGVEKSTTLQMNDLAAMGMEDSYRYRFQLRTQETYNTLRKTVTFRDGPVYGWGYYFEYDAALVFIFLSVLLLTVTVMSCDRTADMLPVIHCTANGKRGTALAKMGVIAVGAVLLALVFSLSTYAVFAVNCGFSDAGDAIQAIGRYSPFSPADNLYIPLACTVGEYHALLLFVRCLGFLLFAALVAAVCALVRHSLFALLGGILLYGGNVYLAGLEYVTDDAPLKNLNLLQVTEAIPVLERFRTVALGKYAVDYLPFTVGLFLVLSALLLGLAALVYRKRRVGAPTLWRRLGVIDRLAAWVRRVRDRLPAIEWKCTRPLKSEWYKLLLPSGMAILLVLLTVLKVGSAMETFTPIESTSDKVYYAYLTRLEGPLTKEKLLSLAEERREIGEIIGNADKVERDFMLGRISDDAYWAFQESYEEAKLRSEYLTLIEDRRDYLLALHDEGREAWFVYDFGWERLFDTGTDWLLLIALCVTLSGVFAVEYKSGDTSDGFARILKTTAKGRGRTFGAKLAVTALFTATISVLYGVIDMAVIVSRYALPAAEAPLISLTAFGDYDGGMTVAQYIPLYIGVRLLFGLLLGFFAAALSAFLKRQVTTLFGAASLILIPAVLSGVGFGFARYVNYLDFLAATPLISHSFGVDLFGGDYGLLVVTALAVASVVGALLWRAWRNFVK